MSEEDNFPTNVEIVPTSPPVKKGIINPWAAIIFRGVTTGALIGLFCHYGIVRRAPKTHLDRVMYIGNMAIGATAGVGIGIDSFKYDLGIVSSYFRKGVDMSYIENAKNPKDPFVNMLIPEKIEDYQLFRKGSGSWFNFNFFNFKDDSYDIRARILKENFEKEKSKFLGSFSSEVPPSNLISPEPSSNSEENKTWEQKPLDSWDESNNQQTKKEDKKGFW